MTTRRRPGARIPVKAHTRTRRARAAGSLSVTPPEWLLTHPWLREAGVPVTAETASQVAAVYGACRLIVDCLVPAPIVTTEIQNGGRRQALHDDPVAWTLNYGAPVRQAPDAPTAQAIEEALFWSALLLGDGNGYAEIQRDNSGKFFALWPIDPQRVTPKRDEAGFYYEVRQYSGGIARMHPMDIFHLRGPSLRGYVGDSIIYRGAKAVGTAQAVQVFSAAYFANGTAISGLLSSDKLVTPDQAKKARADWVERYGNGPANAHGPAVLGQGFKYQPINHNAQEAALTEQKKFSVAEIARFYGVPTALLGENEAWTALSELYRAFYTTLRVWAERFDSEATRKLYPDRQPWREIAHDLTYLTLGSFKDQIAAIGEAVNTGLMSRNEGRELLGKNHIGPDGDAFVVDGKIQSLENVLRPAEPAGEQPLPVAEPGAEPDEPPANKSAPVNTRPNPAEAVLEKHAKRVRARTADLKSKGASAQEIAQHVERLRSQARLEMRAVMGAETKDIAAALESVEYGVDPGKAAGHLAGVAA